MNIEPLCVSPKVAGAMLGYGLTHIHKLIRTGELQSFLDGGARRIMVQSINDYVQRRLEANAKPIRLGGPGRPKKSATTDITAT